MKRIKSTILFFLVIFVHQISAQNQRMFDHITQSEGLPSDHVNEIIQDSDGLMWFATYNGLASYDGYHFHTYSYSSCDSTSISHDNVLCICEESSRYIWVGTTNGFCRYDKEQDVFNRYNTEKVGVLSHSSIRKITIDTSGNLFMGTNVGFVAFNPQNEKYSLYIPIEDDNNSISSSNIRDVYVDKNNKVWIATGNSLELFDPESGWFTHVLDGHFLQIDKHKDGIMAITQDFIRYVSSSVDDISFSKLLFEKAGGNFVVTDVLMNYQGCDWYAIRDKGIYCFNEDNDLVSLYKFDKYDKNSINSNVPQCIYKDNNENLWIGTFDGGVNFYSPYKKGFKNIQDNFKDDGLRNNYVRTLYEDDEGDLWVGTKVGGMLSKFNKQTQTFTHYKHDPKDPRSLSDDYILSITDAQPGFLWVATMSGGLNLFNKKTGKCSHFKHEPGNAFSISSDNVRFLFLDKQYLWMGVHQKGVDVFDVKSKKKIKSYRYSLNPDSISSNAVNVIIKDYKDNLWIGTTYGLNRYDYNTDKFTRYYHIDNDLNGISDNIIHCIVEDKEHYLWIGTKNGLNRYDPATDSFQVFNTSTGLPANSIYGLSIDKNGIVWMSTNAGIVRFDYKFNMSDLYTVKDGLSGNEFAPSVFATSKDGDVFFGGNKGFTYFKPGDIIKNPYLPHIVFTDLKILNIPVKAGVCNPNLKKNINAADEINLFYNDYVFSIEFSALNYISSDKNKYAYKLEGFDKNWHFVNTSHSATYTNLNPGNYTFKVIASNNDSIWNRTGRSICVNVIAPWWNTLLFKITFVLFIILLVLFVFLLRQRVYRIKTSVLEEKVSERTFNLNNANKELNAQKEEILLQNTEIQHQKEQLEREKQKFQVLNKFGQELINILSFDEINRVTFDYVKTLLDISVFGLAIYNRDLNSLEFQCFFEEGNVEKRINVSLNSTNSLAVWCYKKQEVIFTNNFHCDYLKYADGYCIPSITMPESAMYISLTVKGKKVGVMFVHSFKLGAYTKNDLITLQTLASYIAIALDNANAYNIVSRQNKELEQQHLLLEKKVKLRTRELEAAKLKAEESDRLKTSFLANMSHEIRTPLNAIVGFSECLALQDVNGQDKRHMANIIRVNSDSLLQIISDIIDFSKIEAGQMSISKSNVDINELLQELNHSYSFRFINLEKDVKLQMCIVNDGSLEKPILHTDPFRLKQIFVNLIDNAIKFTNQGTIKFGYKGLDEQRLVFYVKDTGIGIAPEYLDVIFERFRKIESDNSTLFCGTGLGLSITKYLIELLEGEIYVNSDVGKGTEFVFTLPHLMMYSKNRLQ